MTRTGDIGMMNHGIEDSLIVADIPGMEILQLSLVSNRGVCLRKYLLADTRGKELPQFGPDRLEKFNHGSEVQIEKSRPD